MRKAEVMLCERTKEMRCCVTSTWRETLSSRKEAGLGDEVTYSFNARNGRHVQRNKANYSYEHPDHGHIAAEL